LLFVSGLPGSAEKKTPASTDFNKTFDELRAETDAQKAQELWIKLNDLVVNNYISVPLIDRNNTEGKVKALQGPSLRPFDEFCWNIADWTRSG